MRSAERRGFIPPIGRRRRMAGISPWRCAGRGSGSAARVLSRPFPRGFAQRLYLPGRTVMTKCSRVRRRVKSYGQCAATRAMVTTRFFSPRASISRSAKWIGGKRTVGRTGLMPSESWSRPLGAEPWQMGGFGLYVHWPFCQSKCPYCDFNSHVVGSVDQDAWARALLSEIYRVGRELGRRPLSTIFFGGGTPSLMPDSTVAAVIEAATDVFAPTNDLEITLEANPGSVEAGRFRGYRAAGVNRVSLGVQALRNDALRALGRLHSAAEAGTAFGDRFARGRLPGLPDEEAGADMYELTQALTLAAGLPAYEISNHARPGSECKHNLIYWRSGDYAGIGPGAHGRLTSGQHRYATEAIRAPGAWLDSVIAHGTGEAARSIVPEEEQLEERLMMGLRLVEGIDLAALPELDQERLAGLERGGWISRKDRALAATPAGRPVLDAVLREILA